MMINSAHVGSKIMRYEFSQCEKEVRRICQG